MKKNRVKIALMQEVKGFNLTVQQALKFSNQLKKISFVENEVKRSGLSFESESFFKTLIKTEALNSSKIEGSNMNYGDLFEKEIDKTQMDAIWTQDRWEVLNLTNIYRNCFNKETNSEKFDYTIEGLTKMHENLFEFENGNLIFRLSKSHIEYIKKTKRPGEIMIDDKFQNYVNITHQGERLYFQMPSKKIEFLKDLFWEVKLNKHAGDENALITLIKFHPQFVMIHPFADGNGRIGRVLLADVFSYLGFAEYNLILMSDYWNKNKKNYIKSLSEISINGDWNQWIDFFLQSLEATTTFFCNQMNQILDLYNEINSNELNDAEKKIVDWFFAEISLNRKITVGKLSREMGIPTTSGYRYFNNVIELLNIEKGIHSSYCFNDLLEIIEH